MCPDAYRAALMREIQRRANPEEDGLEPRGGGPVGTASESGPAVARGKDATTVSGETMSPR